MIKKIAHLADIHIRKLPTRNEEYSKVFANTIKSLTKEKPDRIVVVGDLGHNYIDLGTEQLVLIKKFLKGIAEIAPVIITRGNHDFRKKNSKRLDAVGAIVQTMDVPNITYYDKSGLYPDDNVMWAVWHHGAPHNNPWKTKDGKKVLALKSESGYTHIDLFHDPINGCKSATGFEMKKKSYYSIKDFQGDYTFLGDIHLLQYFHNKTKAYCGSLIAQDFSEGDDQFHGYLLWDIEKGEVKEIPVDNEYSFKNVRLSTFVDFDDLDIEIENPTKYMKIRIMWGTLPSTRNAENERKIIAFVKEKYPNALISHKNDFVVDDTIEVAEDINTEDITEQSVQHEIFTEYLAKIGLEAQAINDVLALDDEVTAKIEVEPNTNIEWSVIKFGGENFMSYKKLDIDWRDMDGLYQISGINTAGKTTVMKLLSYILFGKTLETETRVKFGDSRFLNNKLDVDFCEGYIVLEVNGQYYGIKRRTDVERKKNGEIKGAPTKVDYFILVTPDDEMTIENSIDTLTEDNRVSTQKKIDEIIGSYENYMRVVMTTSDTLNRILSNDMATFIDSLLFDSGLDIFDKKLEGGKEHKRELNKKSRVTCNVELTTQANKALQEEIDRVEAEITDLTDVKLPDVQKRITRGSEYVEELTKKLFKIDPEISDLNVPATNDVIGVHEREISLLSARKGVLEKAIKPLKKSYDETRLTELLQKKEEHKQEEYSQNLKIKEIEREITQEDHKIEIVKGYIHVAKENGAKNKQEISELRASKTCPTCGQILKEEHRVHIDQKIKEIEGVMFSFADAIKRHQKTIDEEHTPKLNQLSQDIEQINQNKEKQSLEMEKVLTEIGELTNDKNEVEKRKEHQVELDQIPVKIQNEELKKANLEEKIRQYNNLQEQIIENGKIQKGIDAAKERLGQLDIEKGGYNTSVNLKRNAVTGHETKIKENEQLIKDFQAQEYQDFIVDTYLKCVHRDGIPRQLLSTYIIPKINVELVNVLSGAPFKVWLDADELRPKLAYYNTPNAVIDAISSCGKERTFSSVVLKMALNEINVKSKPTMFLLDEVMGKLDNYGSVEEFVVILQMLKEKYKKVLIVEQNHEVNPDYLINVSITDGGISSAFIE